jgi:hypothetical protein
MPGWDSLETVTRIHGVAQVAVLILLALLLTGGVLLLVQLRRRAWPEWIDVGQYQVRSLACEVAGGLLVASLVIATLAAHGYGLRKDALKAMVAQLQADQSRTAEEASTRQAEETKGGEAPVAKAERVAESQAAGAENQTSAPKQLAELTDVRRKLSETENQLTEAQRKLSESESRVAEAQRRPPAADNQLAELQRKLSDAESQLAELKHKQAQKRLSDDERKSLIDALAPFAGQKVAVAFRLGDEDGKVLAEDFVAVFKAANWNYGGETGLSVQRWDRDPVGVEIALNEADARAGRIPNGIGALINAVRKLRLTYDNTIYMSRDVPAGQAVVKVGRKLPKS